MTDDLTIKGPPLTLRETGPKPTIQVMWEGRTSTIDFSGSEVTFSGDLPVSEAARVFFESVHVLRESARDEGIEAAAQVLEKEWGLPLIAKGIRKIKRGAA